HPPHTLRHTQTHTHIHTHTHTHTHTHPLASDLTQFPEQSRYKAAMQAKQLIINTSHRCQSSGSVYCCICHPVEEYPHTHTRAQAQAHTHTHTHTHAYTHTHSPSLSLC